MENKTIRVWDKEVGSCGSCIYKTINSGHGYSITACNLLSKWEVNQNIIDLDCPFSKPLSKEDIESCGFIFDVEVFGDGSQLFKRGLTEVLYHKETKLLKIFISEYHRVFSGYINNLPEFKLILKMLNIE